MTEAVLMPPSASAEAIERRRLAYERWLARSRWVRFARRALPAAIVVVLALIAIALAVRGLLQRFGDVKGGDGLAIHMTNAQFFGRDKAGAPFILSAAEAARDDRDLARFVLTMPQLLLDAGTAKASRLSAAAGVYRQDDRIVRLNGKVTVHDSQGDAFTTDRAIINIARGEVNGPAPVRGAGPMGSISARSFVILDHGQRVVLLGNVHSIIKAR